MAEAMVSSTVGEVAKLLVGKVTKETRYMRNCHDNVEKFKAEVDKLKIMRNKVKQLIDIAKDKKDKLKVGVEDWVKKADDVIIPKAEEFLEQEAKAKKTCFKIGWCGNWGTLYHYGKEAIRSVRSLEDHKELGKDYETCVSLETAPPGLLDVYEIKNLDDILTQKSFLEDIIKAIEDESKPIIGIHGLGGVGKTTLAMEVSAIVKRQHLFDVVAFSTVSQNASVEKIKEDLEVARKGIQQGEKVLVILDDVWEELDLQDLCIPRGKYKILLTSRRENVCERMDAHKICVNTLREKEAWIIFKRIVGDVNADLQKVAREVAKECGGLPLFLKVVGNGLKTKSIRDWERALIRLREPAPALSFMDPEMQRAYTRLRLSYDFLGEEVQSCFLLCCMFPEDAYILLEDLVYYAVGLEKFHGLESIDEARQRVEDAVKILTSSGLLLNLEDETDTKMHDVVRDVALIIASEGKNNFLVEAGKGLTEWLPRNNELESYTGISLMNNKITELPDYDLHLPRLEVFLVSDNPKLTTFSGKIFQGMQEVKVLDMRCCNLSVLHGFQFFTKLRVLNLRDNQNVVDISILGKMKDLEILILNNTGIKEIPEEIGELVDLRRLDVLNCEHLKRVEEGVISKLWRLEELLIGLTWLGETIDDRIIEVKNCIEEVMKLSELKYLGLVVPGDVNPEDFDFGKLKRFGIQIGGSRCDIFSHSGCLLIIVAVDVGTPLLEWTKKLIPQKPATILDNIENINNIIPDLSHAGFNEFEHIHLVRCSNVSYLVDKADGEGKINEKFFGELKHLVLHLLYRLEALWNCSDQYISLSNLVTLRINGCDKLARLFSVSVAQGLVNLQELSIVGCKSLEVVIWDGDEETNKGEIEHSESIIVFRSLAKIVFYNLDKLERFYSGYSAIKYPSLVDVFIRNCQSMKIWGPGIHEAPKLKFVGKMPLDGPDATINDIVAKLYEAEREKRAKYMRSLK